MDTTLHMNFSTVVGDQTLYLRSISPDFKSLPMPIGRDSQTSTVSLGSVDADIVIPRPTVSKRHCQFSFDHEKHMWRIEDLGSTNGTFLGSVPITKAWISPGDVISVGDVRLRVVAEFLPSEALAPDEAPLPGLLGDSPKMRELAAAVRVLARKPLRAILQGQTGVGKGVVAKAYHAVSNRNEKPFVTWVCSNVSAELIESELFGHKKGAFTNAMDDRKGVFEQAADGVLFIDEIQELPLKLQSKLLDVLERRVFTALGASQEKPVKCKILTASQVDLEAMVEAGEFRADLFTRIAQKVVRIAPLNERLDDIEILADSFYRSYRDDPELLEEDRAELPPKIPAAFVEAWRSVDWTDRNIRALRGAVLAAASQTPPFSVLPSTAGTEGRKTVAADSNEPDAEAVLAVPYADYVQSASNLARLTYLRALLVAHDNNVSKAAGAAGLARTQLHRELKKAGLR